MKFCKVFKITILILISNQLLFDVSKAKAAEEIKIIYNIFSRTIEVNSLKSFAEKGTSTKNLRKILKKHLVSFRQELLLYVLKVTIQYMGKLLIHLTLYL